MTPLATLRLRLNDPRTNVRRCFPAGCVSDDVEGNGWHIDVQINPIHQRAGKFGEITLHLR